jgi:hypothetical protein
MPKTTYRFFVNNKRVATAVSWQPSHGEPCILEVCAPPIKNLHLRTFDTEAEWREHCERYYVQKQITRVEVTTPDKKPKKEAYPAPKQTWTCPACGLGPGNDHRMCICRAFNYSVYEWERACGIRH